MATITKNRIRHSNAISGAPYGDATCKVYSLELNSSGACKDSNSTSAVQIGDKIRIGVIPGGTQLVDELAIISDPFASGTTFGIGYEYVDGIDDAKVPQDSEFFHGSVSGATSGRRSMSNYDSRPITLPKDAYLTVTVKGSAQSSSAALDVVLFGNIKGII